MPQSPSLGRKQNQILAALSTKDYARLQDDLEIVSLKLGQILNDAGDRMGYVYFPITCIVSLIITTQKGSSAELAITGNEGLVGIPLVLGGDKSNYRVVVQSGGLACRIKVEVMRWELDQGGDLQHLALRYTQALMTQMAQNVVCNRHHAVDQQLCRFILLMLDRLPDLQIHMTHELIGSMLGVRREAVTEAAGKLQAAGLIQYSRGLINVLDRPGLEARVCECYGVVKAEVDRLFRATPEIRLSSRGRPNPETRRKRAEARWMQAPPAVPETPWDNVQLVHELQVHQIELEMHNEELRHAFDEVDALRDRYADIYDFAPVGYFTLNAQGVIIDLNLCGAILLGIRGSQKGRHRFAASLTPDSLISFNQFFADVLEATKKCACEVVLAANSQRPEATIKIEAIPNEAGNECRMVVIDVTAERKAQKALLDSEKHYRGFIEQMPLSIAIVQHGVLQYINAKSSALIGYAVDECLGKPFLPMVFEADRPGVIKAHQAFTEGEQAPCDYEVRLVSKTGQIINCRLHVTSVVWEGERAALAIFEDVTAQKAMQAELRRLSSIDALTGLPSQTQFVAHLAQALSWLKRGVDRTYAVLLLDIDHQAEVTNAIGQLAGDAVLPLFSALLRAQLRNVDFSGRIEGDKFAVLLPETDQAAATIFAERLRSKVAETSVSIGDQPIPITVNIGIAAIQVTDETADQVLQRADQALARAKAGGRNQIALAEPTGSAPAPGK